MRDLTFASGHRPLVGRVFSKREAIAAAFCSFTGNEAVKKDTNIEPDRYLTIWARSASLSISAGTATMLLTSTDTRSTTIWTTWWLHLTAWHPNALWT